MPVPEYIYSTADALTKCGGETGPSSLCMDLRATILAEHSKANCNKIVRWVGMSQQRFDELFELFLNSEYRINQRAAWPLSDCVAGHPQFIQKHFSKLIKNLHKPGIHDSV